MRKTLHYEIEIESGVILREEYRAGGRLHRDESDGPAVIFRSNDGLGITGQFYYRNGRFHRDNGPAKQEFFLLKDGKKFLSKVEYYRNGLLHRDPSEGPAITEYGGKDFLVMIREEYFVRGERYRDPSTGPREIYRFDDDGSIESVKYTSENDKASRPFGIKNKHNRKCDIS